MKTLKRLTALVLIALLLLQSLAFADSTAVETTDDGQVVVDTEWYNQQLQEVQTYGVSYESYVAQLEEMTTTKRYDTLATWAADSPEFHTKFVEYYKMTYPNGTLICICEEPQPYGATTHADTACPWLFANLTVEEQYEIYMALSEAEQEAYMATLSADAVLALEQYIAQQQLGVEGTCDGVSCGYNAYSALSSDVERYRYLMGELYSAEGTAMEDFIFHMLLCHSVDNVCVCGDSDSVVCAPGSSEHTKSYCPWNHETAIGDHYAAYSTLSMANKAFYLFGMDAAQLAAMTELMTPEEAAEAKYLAQTGIPDWLKSDAVRAWLADTEVTVTAEQVALAQQASANGVALGDAIGITADGKLIYLYAGSILAEYDETTGYLTDVRYHIPVAQVVEGVIYSLSTAGSN